MSNADKPAFPRMVEMNWYESTERYQVETEGGMTKLEYFAGLAMQGILAEGNLHGREVVTNALWYAHEMLAELEKEKGV
jgi:hypothetical protein